MAENPQRAPEDNRKGDSAKRPLDTIMLTIQIVLVAIAAVGLLAYGISIHFPLEQMLKMVGIGAAGAILIQIVYFNR